MSVSLILFPQGDYDVVINDYEKAKSLFGNTEVPVFKKGIFRTNKWELNYHRYIPLCFFNPIHLDIAITS